MFNSACSHSPGQNFFNHFNVLICACLHKMIKYQKVARGPQDGQFCCRASETDFMQTFIHIIKSLIIQNDIVLNGTRW